MVRDWVMLSLSNFTQRSPVAMAVWSLSCFFVSASTSPWISAMYPSRDRGPGRRVQRPPLTPSPRVLSHLRPGRCSVFKFLNRTSTKLQMGR